jgi:hypothetical protein
MKRSTHFLLIGLTMSAALLLLAATASAQCGPGPLIVQKNKGIILQTLGATTNATLLPTQAFAITSGTSGCSNSGIVQQQEIETRMFVVVNYDNLASDMAVAQGQHLETLAGLLGCDGSTYAAFSALTRERLPSWLDAASSPDAGLQQLKQAMRAQPALASCSAVS